MLILTDNPQKAALAVAFKNKAGNDAKVDGVPVWNVSDPTILDLTVAADGFSAVIQSKGPLGACQVSVTADADLGAGTRAVSAVLDVVVQAGEAVSAAISAGAPEDVAVVLPPVDPQP